MPKLINKTTKEILCSDVCVKKGLSRLVGLLGKKQISQNHAIVIEKCKQVHTFFMNFPIGVVFLDGDNCVISLDVQNPWRLGNRCKTGQSVIELHPSHIISDRININDCLEF